MEKRIEELYELARRFDEGELRAGEKYRDIVRQKVGLFEMMLRRYGMGIKRVLDEYTGVLYEEMELEAKHFFREGFLAAIDKSSE